MVKFITHGISRGEGGFNRDSFPTLKRRMCWLLSILRLPAPPPIPSSPKFLLKIFQRFSFSYIFIIFNTFNIFVIIEQSSVINHELRCPCGTFKKNNNK